MFSLTMKKHWQHETDEPAGRSHLTWSTSTEFSSLGVISQEIVDGKTDFEFSIVAE